MQTRSLHRFSPSRPTVTYESRQVHLIGEGFYVGFFSRYSEPKSVPNFEKTGMEVRLFLNFLVTHTVTGQALPQITEAGAFVAFKWWYSAEFGSSSRYFDFEASLAVPKDYASRQALFDAEDNERKGLDVLIGRPAILEIVQSPNADRHGHIRLNIKRFMGITEDLRPTLLDFYRTLNFKTNDKGLRFISSPEPSYDDRAGVSSESPF